VKKTKGEKMKKLIAGFLTVMVSLLTVASPVFAAVQLGSYPGFLKNAAGTVDAYVVVGSAAAVDDVVGAVDIAVRLAEVGKATVSQTCSGASEAVDGTLKDTCALGALLSGCFPSSAVLKNAHYSGLKDGTYSFRSNDYDYREQVNFAGVETSHDLSVTNVNGTETMVVASEDIKYQYVFEEKLEGIGSVTTPNYTYPVRIQLLGKDFAIVGTSATGTIKILQGSIGTATATSGVTYGSYTAYSDLGSTTWARVIIKDAAGNTVDTLIINNGDSKQSSVTGLTIMLTTVNALQDGTVVGADIVMGSTADGVVKTYDVTADTTSTGTASDRFPGETDWGIQVGSASFTTTAGTIQVGDIMEVVYKPTTTQYLKAGEKKSLPNSYGDLGFLGFNTDKFVGVTIKPIGGTVSAYWSNDTTQIVGNLNGIEISADVSGSLISQSAANSYAKAYVLFNYTSKDPADVVSYPVMFGLYDATNSKILVNGTFTAAGAAVPATEYVSKYLNASGSNTWGSPDNATYEYTVCYSNSCENNAYVDVTVFATGQIKVTAGNSTAKTSINVDLRNKTAVTTSSAPVVGRSTW
jgi:hypothetical protein